MSLLISDLGFIRRQVHDADSDASAAQQGPAEKLMLRLVDSRLATWSESAGLIPRPSHEESSKCYGLRLLPGLCRYNLSFGIGLHFP